MKNNLPRCGWGKTLQMINYKLIKQEEGFCGPASLKMIFDRLGIIKSQEEWGKLSKASSNKGTEMEGLVSAIESQGYNAKIIGESSFKEIRKYHNEQKDIIVVWWYMNGGHYCPIADIDYKSITLADPFKKVFKKMKLEDFEYFWFSFKKDLNRKASDLVLRTIIVII